jgi:hypothetical protein
MFAILLTEPVSGNYQVDCEMEVTSLRFSAGAHHDGLNYPFTILGFRPEDEAKHLTTVLNEKPELWKEILGSRWLDRLTAEDAAKILAAAEEHIQATIVSKELEGVGPGARHWYDGISFIPKEAISDALRQAAYRAVFTELEARARLAGFTNPVFQHQGNGHYYPVEREQPNANRKAAPWPELPSCFVHLPSEHGSKSSFRPADCSWPVLEVEIEDGATYYLGIQGFCGKKEAVVIVPTPVKTRGVACTMILGYEVTVFATRYPDKVDPLPCRLIEKVPEGTGFDPDKITRL